MVAGLPPSQSPLRVLWAMPTALTAAALPTTGCWERFSADVHGRHDRGAVSARPMTRIQGNGRVGFDPGSDPGETGCGTAQPLNRRV